MKSFKENGEKKQKMFGRGIQVIFVFAIVLAMYFAVTQAPIVPVMKDGKIIGWKDIDMTALGGWATITTGQSGFQKIFIYKHHAGVATYYCYNMTVNAGNASTYGNTWQNNSSNMSAIPYSTTFDIVVYFRWNATHAKSTSNNTWMLQWVRLNISCPELHIHNWATGGATTFQNMSKFNVTDLTLTGTYFWTNFVMNNNGSGYTINKGENVSHCYFQPSAYY